MKKTRWRRGWWTVYKLSKIIDKTLCLLEFTMIKLKIKNSIIYYAQLGALFHFLNKTVGISDEKLWQSQLINRHTAVRLDYFFIVKLWELWNILLFKHYNQVRFCSLIQRHEIL